MRSLPALGVRTVVNLRLLDFDTRKIRGTNLRYLHIPMVAWSPREEALARFLAAACNPSCAPVLVHCRVGADRTGLAVAAYRLAVCSWSKEAAIAEMTGGGFGFNPLWHNLARFLRRLDVEDLRARARSVGRTGGAHWPD